MDGHVTDIDLKTLAKETLEMDFKVLVKNAHKAEIRCENHVESCYICDNAEDWEKDLCEFGSALLDDEIAAWNYVYAHPLWED